MPLHALAPAQETASPLVLRLRVVFAVEPLPVQEPAGNRRLEPAIVTAHRPHFHGRRGQRTQDFLANLHAFMITSKASKTRREEGMHPRPPQTDDEGDQDESEWDTELEDDSDPYVDLGDPVG